MCPITHTAPPGFGGNMTCWPKESCGTEVVSGDERMKHQLLYALSRPLSRRIPPPLPAGSVPRRRRRKKFGAPLGQPKFMDAAAAVFSSARRGASKKSSRC